MNKLLLLTIGLLMWTAAISWGQEQEKVIKMIPTDSIVPKLKPEQPPLPQLENPYIVGGSFSAWVGSRTMLELSPLFLYKINRRTHIGVGGTVGYIQSTVTSGTYEHNYYMARAILRLMILEGLFLHGEYEMINGFKYNTVSGLIKRDWMPSLLVGGTYRTAITNNFHSTLSVFYNGLYQSSGLQLVYGTPLVIRVGFEYEW